MAAYLNRICKKDGTAYRDPGGDLGDPRRCCPTCGGSAWYAVTDNESTHPIGATEIAELLGVKPPTVHMWHYRGIMPTPRWVVSGKPAWLQSEIYAWAEQSGRA